MTAGWFARGGDGGRVPWPEMFDTISGLAQASRLPTPVEIARAGPGTAKVRLESNADAVCWIRRVDPRAAPQRDRHGQVRARCELMGWQLTIVGAPEPPPSYPRARPPSRHTATLALVRPDPDPAARTVPRPWADAA